MVTARREPLIQTLPNKHIMDHNSRATKCLTHYQGCLGRHQRRLVALRRERIPPAGTPWSPLLAVFKQPKHQLINGRTAWLNDNVFTRQLKASARVVSGCLSPSLPSHPDGGPKSSFPARWEEASQLAKGGKKRLNIPVESREGHLQVTGLSYCFDRCAGLVKHRDLPTLNTISTTKLPR